MAQEITERTTKARKGTGRVGPRAAQLGGESGSEVEIQTSYTLQPREKAAVSKVLDGLVAGNHVELPRGDLPLHKDLPLVLEGTARLTTASIAGKLLYVALQAIQSSETSLDDLVSAKMPDSVAQGLKNVYLGNELVPMPMLFELESTGLEPRVLLSLRPGHFVDQAVPDHVEGEVGVLGTVETLVYDDAFTSAEKWLLHGWEWLVKRTLMTTMDDTVASLANSLDVDLPVDDVQAYIQGPAVVVDAVAVY
ncbi:hypothetical protein [Isoptericola sp. NPDC056605]|uniref:hypothetical protein n=1 Tax=Isoptericola sp. NPDC056605 TaxID=3345876 RepID=UPI0036C0191B